MKDQSIKLIRHGLSVVDLSDVENDDNPQTEAERKEYCSAIAAIYPRIKKDIERFLYRQLMFTSNQAETWEQVLVGRGTFAGMEMLLDYWRAINQEYVDRIVPQDFDKNSPIGEL